MAAFTDRKKSVLIVSPTGKPVRKVTIGFISVFFLLLFVICGIAAFFIPPEVFKLKSTEELQKKELGAQNELLYRKFFSALKMLSHVKEQISLLDAKKNKVTALTTGAGAPGAPTRPAAHQLETHTEKDRATLIERLSSQDSAISAFAPRAETDKNPFECLPVCRPVLDNAKISRRFGKNQDPFTGQERPHFGIDIAAPPGTSVIATASGTVSRVENADAWGKRIIIDHGGGISTVYAHLGNVKTGIGRRVKRGDVIGYIGYSGLTTGPHVHYEIWSNGTAIDPEDCFFPETTF